MMKFERDDDLLFQERTLFATMITGKPRKSALFLILSAIAIMALFSEAYWLNIFGLANKLPAQNMAVFQHNEWWRIFTALFIHADLAHFLSNMYMLGIFGFLVFNYFGFYVFPIFTLVVSSIVNLLAIATYAPQTNLLGASGMVYVLGGFWLTMYFLIQRQYKYFNRWLRVTGLALMIFFPSTFVPTTSYRTHAIGFGFGILMGFFYFLKYRIKIQSHEQYRISYVEGPPTAH